MFIRMMYLPTLQCECAISLFSPDVSFCGYTVPHPSENKINLRVQTKGAVEV